MRHRHIIWQLFMVSIMVGGMLAAPTAFAASGHGSHGSGGAGNRTSGMSPSHAGRTVVSVVPARPSAQLQRATIRACPVPSIGSPPSCAPGQWNTGCRCHCHSHGGYFFGNYWLFDEYWFGQYPYSYAAAYQPQVAPDSYYQAMGQQWGKDLKDGTVPQERLVALIQVQMLNIPQHSRKAFRQGFLAGYGAGGEPVLAQIIKQAKESNAQEN